MKPNFLVTTPVLKCNRFHFDRCGPDIGSPGAQKGKLLGQFQLYITINLCDLQSSEYRTTRDEDLPPISKKKVNSFIEKIQKFKKL
jgi:hypothetical protein